MGTLNTHRLVNHIIDTLGKRGPCGEQDLKAEIGNLYSGLPAGVRNSALETALLELNGRGIVEFKRGDQIALTQAGNSEYKSLTARVELKRTRKNHKVKLDLKKREVQEKRAKSLEVHDKLKLDLGQLAHLLGHTWKPEHELVKGGPVRLDLVWYGSALQPTHAFEVHHKAGASGWKNAVGNLEAAKRHYPACRLFLVVHNEKEIGPIRDLLGAQLNNTVKVLRVAQMREWLAILEKVPDDIRPHLVEIVDSIRQSGLIT